MKKPSITYCPGTLAAGYTSYSRTCLRRMFNGRRVHHILPYNSPNTNHEGDNDFIENQRHISLSGIQEKFSVVLEKNKLRLTQKGEQGTYLLKPIPRLGKQAEQIPANEHLSMQIARQLFDIETAENALIFFKDGSAAYLAKRFDAREDGSKWAIEDFASLAGRTPQTHGTHYKYQGNYLELFNLMKKYVPAYAVEAQKLFKLLVFNYLFSNGDAHIKNFSLIETPLGDFRLSPAYDLLNTRLHIDDTDFALEEGLLPKHLAKGKVKDQLRQLADYAGLHLHQQNEVFDTLCSQSEKVATLIHASYLSEKAKRNYLQAYQRRLRKLNRI